MIVLRQTTHFFSLQLQEKINTFKSKIPSEMEVAPRYTLLALLTLLTWFKLLTLLTLLTLFTLFTLLTLSTWFTLLTYFTLFTLLNYLGLQS